MFKDGLAFFLLLVAVVGYTIYKHGAELSGPADPSEQYAAARPEWYFLFLFQLLKKVPEFVGAMVIPTAVRSEVLDLMLRRKTPEESFVRCTS